MKRFGAMLEDNTTGATNEEMEAKRKARMERFGADEVQEAQKDAFKQLNRRKQKMQRKQGGKGEGDKKRPDKFNKNKKKFRGGSANPQKRFRKDSN